jgi:hypothetical protein
MKIGDLVRFNHEKDGGPVHRIVSVMPDSMVELHDMGGYFAPHLFVAADDVAEIPPSGPDAAPPVPMSDAVMAERERCAAIVQAAREGEQDSDLRSIIHAIKNP